MSKIFLLFEKKKKASFCWNTADSNLKKVINVSFFILSEAWLILGHTDLFCFVFMTVDSSKVQHQINL